jgi:hypothetical protein
MRWSSRKKSCYVSIEARAAFVRAAQTLSMLAEKIGDEELKESFLSAPRVRRVLQQD